MTRAASQHELQAARIPDPRVRVTLDELSTVQGLAAHYITFSMTLACLFRCQHCIVDAGPEKGSTTMPLAVAEHYAAQMGDLAAHGIRGVSFTGGEPTLARRQVRVISEAARAAGLEASLVTAAQWAATPESAQRTVAAFGAISHWDVSLDVFHLEWVPFETIRNAHDAIRAQQRAFTLRFTYHDPPSAAELVLLDRIRELDGARIASQQVRAVGRGQELGLVPSKRWNPWVKPCLTQGMVVRYDGSIAPCCLNLVESRRHPFQLGPAPARPLVEIHAEYLRQPLLQLIRTLGFGQLYIWLQEGGLADRLPSELPDEACALCTLLLQDSELASFLKQKVEEPGNRLRIAVIAARSLGEPQMLRNLLEEDAKAIEAADLPLVASLFENARDDRSR